MPLALRRGMSAVRDAPCAWRSVVRRQDIVALYPDPPLKVTVLCADQKSPFQALDRTQPMLPPVLEIAGRHAQDDMRHGVTT